ncbi:MAG: glycosyl hydrolase [Bacteroidota bacterium]
MNTKLRYFLVVFCTAAMQMVSAQKTVASNQLEKNFHQPPQSAKPWVFWYWMHAAVSKKGITADLEAMQNAGIGGAYLMPIQDTVAIPVYKPLIRQLSPEWFAMVRFAMQEAKRLHLQLGIHYSDGFALGGGPWITPELSMQKIVFTKTVIEGGKLYNNSLLQPETNEGYYKDIAVFAYPIPPGTTHAKQTPVITTSNGVNADFLSQAGSKESYRSDSVAWIQYAYPQSFTCRTIVIRTNGNNYQSHRLIVEGSDDGIHFHLVKRLEPPRHGWQDTDADVTHTIPTTTAKYFRFAFDKSGSEAGAEDLDNAKWKPNLKISGIELSAEPRINQYESKNGEIWRVSKWTTTDQLPDSLCVPMDQLMNITSHVINGKLQITLPKGNWTILRIGHTSTGHKNETGGAGKGLECDKFKAAAITLQFNKWFGRIYDETGIDLAKKVLKVFHVDSWECGSQNWNKDFAKEFAKRRGYDLVQYLPVMAGIPLVSAAKSEQVLYDVRQTIAELINDVFYQTLAKLAHEKGCSLSAESVAPTMLSDGMLHYSKSDLPMGEFWLRSPTHDKPNDMLDAISGAHIYGKQIVQSESFTELRMAWDEYPGMLKTIGDRNFALGINKMVFHVFAHNPWMNRQPGYTLDGVGLYFQRNQTWFKQGKAWVDYIARCQSLLQTGKPVVDIAVYTGDELPRRSILPDRIVTTLPGIFGAEKVAAEKIRLSNIGEPLRTIPDGVTHSANMADPENWVNPLNGYAYDSFNPDALIRLAKVENGNIVLPGGAVYRLLVLPVAHPMNPGNFMTDIASKKILQLVSEGATVLIDASYQKIIGAGNLHFVESEFYGNRMLVSIFGKGKFVTTPYRDPDFTFLQLQKDFMLTGENTKQSDIAYTHRRSADADIYFISNQKNSKRTVDLSFRITGKKPELWNAVTGTIDTACSYTIANGRTTVKYFLDENASVFVVFRKKISGVNSAYKKITGEITNEISFNNKWQLQFDTAVGGPQNTINLESLIDWSKNSDPRIKYYSGTAIYTNSFSSYNGKHVSLELTGVHDIASVKVNGIDCGTLWTPPFKLDISHAIKNGNNTITIAVTNTWRNRLIGDHDLLENKRITFTTAPYRLEGKPLLSAGLTGYIKITSN